jgi:hypothetical protein
MKEYTIIFTEKGERLNVKADTLEVSTSGKYIILYGSNRIPIALFPAEHVNGVTEADAIQPNKMFQKSQS